MANREFAPIRQKLRNDFAFILLQIAKTYIQLLGECSLDLDKKTFGSSSISFHRVTSPLPKAISDLHKNNKRLAKLLLQSWIDQSERLSAVKILARLHFRGITAACVSITGEIIVARPRRLSGDTALTIAAPILVDVASPSSVPRPASSSDGSGFDLKPELSPER
jgi:hypothetical protein